MGRSGKWVNNQEQNVFGANSNLIKKPLFLSTSNLELNRVCVCVYVCVCVRARACVYEAKWNRKKNLNLQKVHDE